MRLILTSAIAVLQVSLPLVGAQAADGENKAKGTKYEAVKGVYAQGGFAVSKNNGFFGNAAGSQPNLGFAIAGGYRINEWLGTDVEFYWAGREQNTGVKSRQFGLTFNGKFYPFGLFSPDFLDSFQPYGVVGMGGGNAKYNDFGKTGTFIFRLGAGIDWLLTENLALYTDVSLHATPGLKFNGFSGGATGVYQLGAKFNF